MLQFITFARLGAIAGAINFNNKGLIPSSPVATFDERDLMISKTSRSEIVGMMKSAQLSALLRLTKSTKLVRSGFINDVISIRDEMLVEYVGYFFRGSIAGSVFGYRVYSTQLSHTSRENTL